MRLPELTEMATAKDNTEEFKGYNHNLRNEVGEWYDQKNMATDYYPTASPRDKRAKQMTMPRLVVIDTGAGAQSYDVTGCVGLAYSDGKVVALQNVFKFKTDEHVHCWLSVDKHLLPYRKNNHSFIGGGVFENINKVRSIVRMGSYICVFPDGAVYESANIDDTVPVYKIAQRIEPTGVLLQTVIEDNASSTGYTDIPDFEDSTTNTENYRISDGQVQYYVKKSGMWVTQQTYVKISAAAGTFDDFSEGDALFMKFECEDEMGDGDIADITAFYGLITYDWQKKKFNETSIKILKKGADGDYLIVNGFIGYTYMGSGSHTRSCFNAGSIAAVSFTRKKPEIAFACESQNRIWACSKDGHEIYASALGNPYNFYDYSGLATDSYAVNVGTDGEFTGCVNYMGQPLFFKENALHYISGSYPSNNGSMDGMSYAVTTLTDFKGVEKGSEKSFAIIDNILYYKSAAGIVAYDGANTVVVSDALGKERYRNAVAGAYKNKYYVSMQDKNGVYHLFVYDTELGTWCKEDNLQVLQFLPVRNELLYVNAVDNCVYSVSTDNVLELNDYEQEDDFDWECETGNFGYSYPNNKYLSRFQVRMQIADGAKASIYIQYNSDGVWHRKGEMTGKGVRTHLIPIVPIRCDHMKIKFAGKGDVKIFSIAKIFEEGGDV